MTSISGLSSSLINSYQKFEPYKNELTTENMFQMLSLEVGGDGETIKKDQLNSYIEDAEDGTADISKSELKALKTIQEDWDKIAGKNADSINYKNMEDSTDLLLSAVTGGISVSSDDSETTSSNSATSSTEDVYNYIKQETLKTSYNISSGKNSSNDAQSLLETLLTGNTDEEDDNNADLIATLVNFIADSQSASTIEVKA